MAFCQAKKEKLKRVRKKETEEDKETRKRLLALDKKRKNSKAGDIYDAETWSSEKKY